jgi:hypothetical protein
MSVAKGVPKYEGKMNVFDTMMTLKNVWDEGRGNKDDLVI